MPNLHSKHPAVTAIATLFALLAFAGNSVLCRLALLPINQSGSQDFEQTIDASSFTIIRLLSGGIALYLLVLFQKTNSSTLNKASTHTENGIKAYLAPFCLFVYAITFSFAYLSLPTGTGALVLFGSVQLCMIASSLMAKEALSLQKYVGIFIAFAGLCLLVYFQNGVSESTPHVSAETTPSFLFGFVFMLLSGIAWAVYTLLGRHSHSPLLDTKSNFIKTLPFCALLCFIYFFIPATISPYGVFLALMSGVVTSAMGYAVWYFVLTALSRVSAGVLQLLVPVIAALGGLIWAQEAIGLALILSQGMVLGGVALVIVQFRRKGN